MYFLKNFIHSWAWVRQTKYIVLLNNDQGRIYLSCKFLDHRGRDCCYRAWQCKSYSEKAFNYLFTNLLLPSRVWIYQNCIAFDGEYGIYISLEDLFIFSKRRYIYHCNSIIIAMWKHLYLKILFLRLVMWPMGLMLITIIIYLVNISECIHVLSEFASKIHFLHLQIHIQRIVHPMFTNPWPCPSYLDSVQILDWYVLQLHCINYVIKKMHFHVIYLFVNIFIMLYLYIITYCFALLSLSTFLPITWTGR